MENTIIPNPKKLESITKQIQKGTSQNLHIISDFDNTLTNPFSNGKKTPSLISILRDGNYLTPDYAKQAHALFEHYHAIELNPNIPNNTKKEKMHEWWTKHFKLLIESGLNKKDLEKAIKSETLKLRNGALEFFDILNKHNIPLIILSADGLGIDGIKPYLEKEKRLYKNITIISNSYEWDKNGNATKVKQPIIHCMNKDETSIQNFPIFNTIKTRKNVILIGDSPSDTKMIGNFQYDNLIKIGFLNQNIQQNLEEYKQKYDIILTNNPPMTYINTLIKSLIK